MQNRQRPEKLVSFMDVQVRVEYDRSNRVSTRTDNRPAHTAARPEEGQFLCRGPGPLPPPRWRRVHQSLLCALMFLMIIIFTLLTALTQMLPVIITCIIVSGDYYAH